MTSEIRANIIKNRVGLGTIEYSNTGPIISGVTTALNFKTGTSNLHSTGLNVQDLDVDGHTNLDNVSIAGVTTTTGNLNVTDGRIFIAQSSGPQVRINSSVGDSSATRFVLGLATVTNGFINGAQSNDACIIAPQEIKFGIGNNLKFRITNSYLIPNVDLIPSANNVRSLGLSNYRWTDLYSVDANISGDLDVDGHTNLDNVSVAGVTTFTGNANFGSNGSITSSANFTLSSNALTVTGGSTVVGEFKGATIPTIQVTQTTNNTDLQLRANSGGGLIRTASNTALNLGTFQINRIQITNDGKVQIGLPGSSTSLPGAVEVVNIRAMTDGNLIVRAIGSISGAPSGSGVGIDVLNDANNAVKDLAIRGSTVIFMGASA